jgi:hypothetical protein
MPHVKMRLKLVAFADFRKGVPTHVEELKRARKFPELGNDDVVLLLSQTGLQLAFVFKDTTVQGRNGDPVECISHIRVQLSRHTPWHPRMLQTYASRAGFELVGLKSFEDWYREEYGALPALPDNTKVDIEKIERRLKAA